MRYLDLTLSLLPANLALDEALLLHAEAAEGGEALRVWEWPHYAVVLGSGCKLADEVNEPACRADNVPIVRRASGGGTVLLGPGCLLYSLVLRYDRDAALGQVRASYRYIFERISQALTSASHEGTSDLAMAGRKFSGNAQQRKRTHLLHHGTLLFAFDIERIARYLKPPPREPEYRAGRAHSEFLCNLRLNANDLKSRLAQVWQATPTEEPALDELVQRLVAEKYGNDEWTRRR